MVAEGVVVAPGIKFAEFNLMSVEAIGKEDLPLLDNAVPHAEAEIDDPILFQSDKNNSDSDAGGDWCVVHSVASSPCKIRACAHLQRSTHTHIHVY